MIQFYRLFSPDKARHFRFVCVPEVLSYTRSCEPAHKAVLTLKERYLDVKNVRWTFRKRFVFAAQWLHISEGNETINLE